MIAIDKTILPCVFCVGVIFGTLLAKHPTQQIKRWGVPTTNRVLVSLSPFSRKKTVAKIHPRKRIETMICTIPNILFSS
jgi:hypothetical protein